MINRVDDVISEFEVQLNALHTRVRNILVGDCVRLDKKLVPFTNGVPVAAELCFELRRFIDSKLNVINAEGIW